MMEFFGSIWEMITTGWDELDRWINPDWDLDE